MHATRWLTCLLLVLTQLYFGASRAQSVATAEDGAPVRLRLDARFRHVNIEEADKRLPVDVTTARAVAAADIVFTPTLKATVELIHSDFLPPKRFNDDPAVFASPYPLLPDPRYTGLNELHVTWTPNSDWWARGGRQSVKLGNERHISDDNFRQVPLLFDGLLLRGQPFDRTQLTLGQFDRLRTRSGSVEPMQLTLAQMEMNPFPDVSASLYAIRHRPLSNEFNLFRFGVAALSNRVIGVIADGSFPLGDVRGYYTVNVADQRSDAAEPLLRARYWRVGAGAGWAGWITRVDHEVKGSNAGRYGFQTPLTNQYAFNGNALVFFDTPKRGLRDSWATLRWEQGQWSFLSEYHWFRSDFGNQRFGQEFDANATYTIDSRMHVAAQWARYRPATSGIGMPVDKIWLTVGYGIK